MVRHGLHWSLHIDLMTLQIVGPTCGEIPMIVSIHPIYTYMLDFIAHVPAMSALLRNTGRSFVHIEWLRFSTSLIWQEA